jgi:hypothetical protein
VRVAEQELLKQYGLLALIVSLQLLIEVPGGYAEVAAMGCPRLLKVLVSQEHLPLSQGM